MDEWQPIETAPRHETIDLWCKKWHPHYWKEDDQWRYERAANCWRDGAGRWYQNMRLLEDLRPTHWMPVPKPPSNGRP